MKYIKYLIFVILCFCFLNITVYAKYETHERSNDNLLVPDDVVVTEKNKKDILNTYAVDTSEKIYDFADILTVDEENKLYDDIIDYTKNTNIDCVILTTKNLKDFDIANYTFNFYDYNDFLDEGIIFTIYVNPVDNKTTIYMGNSGDKSSKVFKVYDDVNINGILKYVYENDIRDGNYYNACSDYLKISRNLYIKRFGNFRVNDEGEIVTNIPWFYVFIISLSLTFITVVVIYGESIKKRRRVDNSIKRCLDTKEMIVKKEYDKLISASELKQE